LFGREGEEWVSYRLVLLSDGKSYSRPMVRNTHMLNPGGPATRFSSWMGEAETLSATAARARKVVKNLTILKLGENGNPM